MIHQGFVGYSGRSGKEAIVIISEEESFSGTNSDGESSEYDSDSLYGDERPSINESNGQPAEDKSDESEPELDVRDMFLLMPKRREQIRRLRKIKVQFKYYEQLPPEIIFRVMRYTKPDDLLNLIRSGPTTAGIWNRYKIAVLRGIQEEQFSDFTGLFEKVGSAETGEQTKLRQNFHNAEQSLRKMYQAKAPGTSKMTKQIEKYGNEGVWRQIGLLEMMKEHLDSEVNAVCRTCADSAPATKATRQGLLTLWRLRWEARAHLGEQETQKQDGDTQQTPVSDVVRRLDRVFQDQPAKVKSVTADIMSLVVYTVVNQLGFEEVATAWIPMYTKVVTLQPLQPEDLDHWIDRAIVSFIVKFVLVFGVAETLRLGVASDADSMMYSTHLLLEDFSSMLVAKMCQDQYGLSDGGLDIVELGLGVAQGMRLQIPCLLKEIEDH